MKFVYLSKVVIANDFYKNRTGHIVDYKTVIVGDNTGMMKTITEYLVELECTRKQIWLDERILQEV